jgi:N-acetylglucosamine-6-phosphate deacetylase
VRAAFDGTRLVSGDVLIEDGRVAAVGLQPPAGSDLLAAPGFVDLQVNGFAGVDLQTADLDGFRAVGQALAATGVTAYQPTIITAARPQLEQALERAAAAASLDGPRVLPAHLEGPFLSPRWPGAHPVEHLAAPDVDWLIGLCQGGRVGEVTLAPELPGGLELVATLAAAGVTVAVGHSDATAEQAHAAFDAGARVLTHAFNAHRRLTGRDPGPAGAALTRDDVWVHVIADGVHLAPEILRLVHRAVGPRLVAVTDAMTAAGLGDGDYAFGPLDVHVRGGRATLADGRLAGSVATLDRCLRELVAAGIPVEDALAAVTSRPSQALGRPELGRLRVGGSADIVLLDRHLLPVRTLIAGAVVFERAVDAA